MAYDFEITDGRLGQKIESDGLSCSLELKVHELLFLALDNHNDSYPHLFRFKDYFSDGSVGHESLELFINEIELASSKFEHSSPFKPFFEKLHALSCLAWACDGSIAAYCD